MQKKIIEDFLAFFKSRSPSPYGNSGEFFAYCVHDLFFKTNVSVFCREGVNDNLRVSSNIDEIKRLRHKKRRKLTPRRNALNADSDNGGPSIMFNLPISVALP